MYNLCFVIYRINWIDAMELFRVLKNATELLGLRKTPRNFYSALIDATGYVLGGCGPLSGESISVFPIVPLLTSYMAGSDPNLKKHKHTMEPLFFPERNP
jgi:hypothetical protein